MRLGGNPTLVDPDLASSYGVAQQSCNIVNYILAPRSFSEAVQARQQLCLYVAKDKSGQQISFFATPRESASRSKKSLVRRKNCPSSPSLLHWTAILAGI
jgi:hypothetical protein